MSAASVQELEGISVVDDEGRLYNETYRSEHSRDDGERYVEKSPCLPDDDRVD